LASCINFGAELEGCCLARISLEDAAEECECAVVVAPGVGSKSKTCEGIRILREDCDEGAQIVFLAGEVAGGRLNCAECKPEVPVLFACRVPGCKHAAGGVEVAKDHRHARCCEVKFQEVCRIREVAGLVKLGERQGKIPRLCVEAEALERCKFWWYNCFVCDGGPGFRRAHAGPEADGNQHCKCDYGSCHGRHIT